MNSEPPITVAGPSPRIETAAIVFLDLALSGILMNERESETISFLERSNALFNKLSSEYSGELIKNTGDGALLVFPTSYTAISCAIAIHEKVASITGNLGVLAAFRIGIHLGEVYWRDGDVFGQAVNLAARLESIAEPGGICVSQEVYQDARGSDQLRFASLGPKRLKNVSGQVHVYAVTAQRDQAAKIVATPFSIQTIGGLSALQNGTDYPLPRGNKARGVLAMISASPNGSEYRGSLAAAIWPDRQSREVSRLVDRTVQGLSRAIPLRREGNRILLEENHVKVDLRCIGDDLNAGTIDPMLMRMTDWPDQILDGHEHYGPVFLSWLAVTRNDWRTRFCEYLERCLERFAASDIGMRNAAQALLQLEPAHERAARDLIRHYRSVDNPGEAKRVYDRLSHHLMQGFGLSPKPETEAALREPSARIGISFQTVRKPLRIQIGEFGSLGNPRSGLAEGLRNELIASLASFRGWSVVEVAQPETESSEFGDYKLTANYSELAASIDLQLLEPAGNRVVWSQSFSLGSNSFEATRKSVVGKIAATLEVYVATDRVNAPTKTASNNAVDLWLRGERLFSRWSPEDHDAAAQIFERLIDEEPDFAPAYASLASLYNVRHIVRPGLQRDAVASHRAYQLADLAAELDPLDARNQLAVAWSASLEGDFDKAVLHMNMAARLNPNSPRTIVSCAMAFAFFGEHVQAGELLEHSLRCAPYLADYQWCYAASVYYLAGDHEAAVTAARRGRDRIIDNPGWHAAALVELGRKSEAAEQFKSLVQSIRSNWHSNEPATPEAVFDWFIGIYAMRRREETEALAGALEQVVS